jgi:hypothetical protein
MITHMHQGSLDDHILNLIANKNEYNDTPLEFQRVIKPQAQTVLDAP